MVDAPPRTPALVMAVIGIVAIVLAGRLDPDLSLLAGWITVVALVLLADHGMASDVLAYPYGEYNEVVVEIARDLGFEIMFAQDEGAVDERTDPRRIPRFAIVGKNLDMDRFVFKLNTAPLHVVDVEPNAVELAQNPPEGFSMRLLDPKRYRPGVINMFVSEWGRVDAQFDRGTGVFSYRCSTALTRPMNRLIVTAREKESGHFSMFSRPYFLPFDELGGRD